jgi:hypothetical protein
MELKHTVVSKRNYLGIKLTQYALDFSTKENIKQENLHVKRSDSLHIKTQLSSNWLWF